MLSGLSLEARKKGYKVLYAKHLAKKKNYWADIEKQINDLGGKASSYCCDITVPDQAKRLIDHTIEKFGKLLNESIVA